MRVRQVSAMFDCPVQEKSSLHWQFDFPHEAQPWNVGLIVGPSGSGKSTVARSQFGSMPVLKWDDRSLIDNFPAKCSIEQITTSLGSVGLNTIPAWSRPFHVLSNGEQFRADIARRIVELEGTIMVDEFTSVVDRQVAQIASNSIQKMVRKQQRQFVAVTCHYDVIDWLQPDWVLDMSTRSFTRRLLQRRPSVECTVARVPYSAWKLFAPFHYMSADLHRAARCFGLWVGDRLAAFAGVIHFPHPKVNDVKRVSRLVTLPDYQGMGLAFALVDKLGSAYKAAGLRLRCYPAHPALVRSYDRSALWSLKKEPGTFDSMPKVSTLLKGAQKLRPNAVFEYCGPAMDQAEAKRLIESGT